MNLKQFKESIQVGNAILCISIDNHEPNEKMNKMRYVSYKDTTGFYMKYPSDRTRGSFCEYPKASELTVTGDTFTIKDAFGKRVYQRFNN